MITIGSAALDVGAWRDLIDRYMGLTDRLSPGETLGNRRVVAKSGYIVAQASASRCQRGGGGCHFAWAESTFGWRDLELHLG